MTITTPDDIAIKRIINTLSIKQLTQFTAVALCALSTLFLLACSSSSAYLTTNRPPADCIPSVYSTLNLTCDSTPFSLATNPVLAINISDLSSSNLFAVLKLLPFRKNTNLQSEVPVKLEVSAFTLSSDGTSTQVVPTETKELEFDCSDSRVSDCEAQNVLTLDLESKQYYIVVKFVNGADLNGLFSDLAFTTTSLNLGVFTTKILLLAAAAAGFYFYNNKMKDLKTDFYCEEQKLLQFLFPLIFVIDEPFSFYVFGGFLYTWVKLAAYVAFSTLLIRFWLSMAHRIAGPDPLVLKYTDNLQAVKIYLIVYAAIAWLTYVIFHASVSSDPSQSFASASGFFFNFFCLLLLVVVVAGIVWIGRSIRVILKESTVFSQREGYFLLFSMLFLMIHAYLVVRGGLDPLAFDAGKQILFSGVSTLYVLCLAYLYLPSQDGISQANHLKKYANPAMKDKYSELDDSVDSPPSNLIGGLTEEARQKEKEDVRASSDALQP